MYIKVGLKRHLISERLFDLNLRCSDKKSQSFSYWRHQPMPLDLEGSPSNGQDRWCQLEEWRKRLMGVDNFKLISPFKFSKGRFQEVAHGFNPYPFLNSSTMSLILRRTLRHLLRHLKYICRIKVTEKNRIDLI